MDDLNRVTRQITQTFDSEHLPRVQSFVRQPSISATGEGVLEAAALVMREMEDVGATKVHLAPIPAGEFGHPHIYGEVIEDPGLPTMLLYSMYDVQPVNPEEWFLGEQLVEPFSAGMHQYEWVPGYTGECLIGRGAMNQKGPTQAFFNVLRSIRAAGARLPCNIIFAIEGEEELGSIHMEGFIEAYKDELARAGFAYFPFFSERYDGVVTLHLGSKGIIPLKIRLEGGDWGGPAERDVHSAFGGVIQNPILKMAGLLTSLKDDETGRILVPGIMDDPDILEISDDDMALLGSLAASTGWEEMKRSLGVRSFRKHSGLELSGVNYYIEELFKPGLSINGISSGYVGDGMKTIVPQAVSANLDIRLPPFQRTDRVRQLYEDYISSRWPMAALSFGRGYAPAKVSIRNAYVESMIHAMQSMGKQVRPIPLMPGSAPFSLFQEKLGIPIMMGGLAHGGRQHSANEYAVLRSESGQVGGIREYELWLARFLFDIPRAADAPGSLT